jgi:hypothetical protein
MEKNLNQNKPSIKAPLTKSSRFFFFFFFFFFFLIFFNFFWALKPFIFESCWYFSRKPRILQLKRLNPRSATNQTVVPLSHATRPESDWLNGSDWDTSI